MAATPPPLALDTLAPDFRLPGTDWRTYAFNDIAGENGTVIVFICNHCPYVKAVIDRLVADARALIAEGIGFAAIAPMTQRPTLRTRRGDAALRAGTRVSVPLSARRGPAVAQAYGAVCTPDFFGYNAHCRLKYRGRLDEGRTSPPPSGARRELLEAMRAIAATDEAPPGQVPSIGCSIKWKAAA